MVDVDELLSQMTVEEKCAQLAGVWFAELATDHLPDPAKLESVLTHGIGQVSRVSAQTGAAPVDTAAMANQIQRHLVEQTRLGIPAIVHEESTGGFCARQATQFPHGTGLAATWDPELAEEVAAVIGRQLRAVGARMTLAPVVDVARDPRWGRVEETYGEDPELASRMAVAYVRGVQSQGVISAVKHFVGHGAHEGGLNWGWVSAGPRHLRDVLAAPFRAAINEAGAGGIMPSYNEVDGLPLHGSRELLTDLLRDELGFEGVTVADYFGVSNLRDFHRTAVDAADAGRQALLAGLDVELPSYDCYRTLPEQVEAGTVAIDVIDAACRRVLVQKVEIGLFDDPYVDAGVASATFDTPEDRALARRAVAESVVVVANDGVLPLQPGLRVAVVGPSADDARRFLGDYHFPSHLELAAADLAPQGESVSDVLPQNPTPTVVEALRGRVDLVDDPAGADVAVVCVGGRSGLTQEDTLGRVPRRHRPPAPGRPARPDRGGGRHGDPGGGGRRRWPGPLADRGRGPRRRDRAALAPGRRGRERPGRRAHRGGRRLGSAAGQPPADRRPGRRHRRRPPRRGQEHDLGRLRRQSGRAVVPVRPRAVVHDLGAVGPDRRRRIDRRRPADLGDDDEHR